MSTSDKIKNVANSVLQSHSFKWKQKHVHMAGQITSSTWYYVGKVIYKAVSN